MAEETKAPKMTYYALQRYDGGVEIMHCIGDTNPDKEMDKWTFQRQGEIDSWREIQFEEIAVIRATRSNR